MTKRATEGQIQRCDEEPTASDGRDGRIVICDEEPEPSEGRIVICPLECDPDMPALTISGAVAPSVGSQYTAAGGKPPYQYSISAGEIAAGTGTIASLSGACGTGTVTVVDVCNNSAGMSVRFPSGQWVLDTVTGTWACNATDFGFIATHIGGTTKTEKLYCCLPSDSVYNKSCASSPVPCCNQCSLAMMDSFFDDQTVWKTIQQVATKTYSWECP